MGRDIGSPPVWIGDSSPPSSRGCGGRWALLVPMEGGQAVPWLLAPPVPEPC